MTGSGATCFSIFENKESLESAEKMIKLKFPFYWVMNTKLVNSINDINLV
jgi:4-diphosphocytidyl-2C-methyl-D-erythritol kinase